MNVTATRCGWARFSSPGAEGAVRFGQTDTGRYAAVEVVAVGDPRRQVQTQRLEAWANGPGLTAVSAGCAERLTMGSAREHVDAGERTEVLRRWQWGTGDQAEAEQEAALALAVDPGPGDDFYAEVARAYGEAAVAGPNPVTAVAAANGVPRERVYVWVKTARKRGLMPPARRGEAA